MDAASIAFDRIVTLILSGAVTPPTITLGQAAAARAHILADERARQIAGLRAAGVRVSPSIAAHELRELVARQRPAPAHPMNEGIAR